MAAAFDGLSPEAQRKVAAQIHAAAGGKTMDQVAEAATESKLQADVEKYLLFAGVARRTKAQISAGNPRSGWMIHLHKAQRNPLILDILLLYNDGKWLEIELKTATGRTQQHQNQLIGQDPERRKLCRSVQEVKEVMDSY